MEAFTLRNGTDVAVRPIQQDDGPRISAAYKLLSPESRYARFLAAKPNLSPAEVKYLVEVDPSNHVALVATLARDPERIIGVARFVRLPDDPRVAEFAVVIGDEWQGQGLASELLMRLARHAPACGIERVRATMLADNERAHRLLNGLAGPRSLRRRGAVDELEIDLTA